VMMAVPISSELCSSGLSLELLSSSEDFDFDPDDLPFCPRRDGVFMVRPCL
jgi:hypothetical protein